VTKERVLVRPDSGDALGDGRILEYARRRGFAHFVVDAARDLPASEGEEMFRTDGSRFVPDDPGRPPIPLVRVSSPGELEQLVETVAEGATLAVEWTNDRLIPLENLVAGRGKRFHLWTLARRVTEVPGALGALEHGADRVIVVVRSPQEVEELEHLLEGLVAAELAWESLPLHSVRPVGVGDRVIVDTTSLLRPEEGFLVGSSAGFLFHVASEAVGSKFSRARPFRVNAGAAHSYVLMADGTTRYLTELSPGDGVLATTPDGASRMVRVGRLKTERRPLVLLEAEDGTTTRTIFLQEAETVRVSTEEGRQATTDLAAGARLRGVRLPPARHLGRAVEETIEER
jgi:3-dehydroquinate synthase II